MKVLVHNGLKNVHMKNDRIKNTGDFEIINSNNSSGVIKAISIKMNSSIKPILRQIKTGRNDADTITHTFSFTGDLFKNETSDDGKSNCIDIILKPGKKEHACIFDRKLKSICRHVTFFCFLFDYFCFSVFKI